MNSKQLMIGDYVIQDDNIYENRICQITGLFDHTVVEVTGESVPLHESHIKPIVLTPEILEKIGFTLTTPTFHTYSEDKVYQIESPSEQLLAELEYQESDYNEYYVLRLVAGVQDIELYIRYLHELQHVLNIVESKIKIDL